MTGSQAELNLIEVQRHSAMSAEFQFYELMSTLELTRRGYTV